MQMQILDQFYYYQHEKIGLKIKIKITFLRSRDEDDYGFAARPSNGQPPLPVLKNLTNGTSGSNANQV